MAVMNRLEQKRMSLVQRGILGLLFLVCVLLVVVLLPVNEGDTEKYFVRHDRALFGKVYNSTYPISKPTRKSTKRTWLFQVILSAMSLQRVKIMSGVERVI